MKGIEGNMEKPTGSRGLALEYSYYQTHCTGRQEGTQRQETNTVSYLTCRQNCCSHYSSGSLKLRQSKEPEDGFLIYQD